jgi:hypothetical protein
MYLATTPPKRATVADSTVKGGDDLAQILGSSRADSGVEPTRSQNITVSTRRSASADRASSDGAPLTAAPSSLRSAAIALSSSRRWPTAATPNSSRSSTVSSGSTRASMAFFRNASSY